MTIQALFTWPPQAAVGRQVSKTKIYAHAKPGAALRALFAQQVETITWAYKLSPETINVPSHKVLSEIDVFELVLKVPEVSYLVLRCIDKAIPRPILFDLRFAGHTRQVSAYKRPSESTNEQWVLGDYHSSPWQKDEQARTSLPLALDMQSLYEQILRWHLPFLARPGETLAGQLERLATIADKKDQEVKLEARIHAEKQFNRKVEINAQLRTIRAEIEALTN